MAASSVKELPGDVRPYFGFWVLRTVAEPFHTELCQPKAKHVFLNLKIGGYLAYTPWDCATQGARVLHRVLGGTLLTPLGTVLHRVLGYYTGY